MEVKNMNDQTDLERFIELYKSFGIECIVNEEKDSKVIYLTEGGAMIKGKITTR